MLEIFECIHIFSSSLSLSVACCLLCCAPGAWLEQSWPRAPWPLSLVSALRSHQCLSWHHHHHNTNTPPHSCDIWWDTMMRLRHLIIIASEWRAWRCSRHGDLFFFSALHLVIQGRDFISRLQVRMTSLIMIKSTIIMSADGSAGHWGSQDAGWRLWCHHP